MEPTRRGFLGGLLGVFAAPAIVRIDSIMPVKVMPTEEILGIISSGLPGGFLSLEKITREAIRIFELNCREIGVRVRQPALQGMDQQSFVDLQFSTFDRHLPLDKFSERNLVPAMRALAEHHSGQGPVSFEPLNLINGAHEGVTLRRGRVHLRGTTAYDITTDTFRTRFDVGSKKRL